jgi:hypothetical protein
MDSLTLKRRPCVMGTYLFFQAPERNVYSNLFYRAIFKPGRATYLSLINIIKDIHFKIYSIFKILHILL